MKKQLLIAAIAATMSAASYADISIKGDAQFRYANKDNDNDNTTENSTGQSVRLHITGKSGNTTVKLGLRNDGGTRVSDGARFSGDAEAEGSGRGLGGENAIFATDYLFLTTKIGALKIKAGDWWTTTGLGLAAKGQPNPDQIEVSTKIAGWDVSFETGADDSNIIWGAEGKIGGWNVDFEYDSAEDSGYTDVAVKGKLGNIGVAAEVYLADDDVADANVVHLWTKAGGITWHIARAEWDQDTAGTLIADANDVAVGDTGYQATYLIKEGGNRVNNVKFSPLGVSILGSAPGINGNLAIGNVNRGVGGGGAGEAGDTEVTGIRADAKVAGMGVQATFGNLQIGATDESFSDIIVTRSLGKGSNIKFSTGEWNDIRTAGIKVSVKF